MSTKTQLTAPPPPDQCIMLKCIFYILRFFFSSLLEKNAMFYVKSASYIDMIILIARRVTHPHLNLKGQKKGFHKEFRVQYPYHY